ncbi:CDP-alcohol phosphatidyltransferase family protein [Blastomonas marina]|uniref:CDP-alcohol phosphatidyltransferase family protein n=1 Tax=Blastomonas marina TaxID=1867408 RepID=UPI002AC9684A|nr:CDP-alcohol phosphatidyltransferase family protein [Blastomonas marina]WPZ05115.1 CDP-alcohol phosphatidyltransferase family protein [Blastomonas marina]
MRVSRDEPDKIERIQHTLVTRAERAALDWLCTRLPRWVTPDKLTLLAILAAVGIGLCYVFAESEPVLLWVAIGLFVVHWFGDSLDGSIARHRSIERPNYGFFIDHSSDMLAGLLILGGLGLSPFVKLEIALLTLAGYYLVSIHTFLLAKVTGEFHLSHGGLGPTEIRIAFILVTICMIVFGTDVPQWRGFSLWDGIVAACGALMIAIYVTLTIAIGTRLSGEDKARLAKKRADQETR